SVAMRAATAMANVRPSRQAGNMPGRPSSQTYPCTGRQMQQNANNHTESKIINQIIQQAGGGARAGGLGFLRMNIVRQARRRPADQWVCDSCQDVICSAVECGLDIALCEDGEEISPAEVQQRCATGD